MNPLLRAALPYLIGAGALLALGLGVAWYGSHREAEGVTRAQLEAAANARQIEAQYRRQEQELATDYAARLEEANEATRLSIADRDLLAASADGLRVTIAAQRARAAQAAARAGVSEQAATRAWDVLKTCTDEYAALAADADRTIDGLRAGHAWASAVAKAKR